jgi:DnaJ-class molecular chaperone
MDFVVCKHCNGQGFVAQSDCDTCEGSGALTPEEARKISGFVELEPIHPSDSDMALAAKFFGGQKFEG